MEIHFLNLSTAQTFDIQKAPIETQQKLINWLQFINTDDKEVRTMLAMTSPILQMLNEKIDVLSLTPEERKLYESRMKLKSDIATISEVQFNAGRQEGKLETARILKQLGDSVQKIMQATGLSQAEVEALN